MGRTPAGETRERIYRFLRQRLLAGQPPTTREVRDRFGFRAVQSAREHLERLVEEGRLTKRPGARGYRLPPGPLGTGPLTQVPILGRVQAGALTTAVEDIEGYVAVESRTDEDELFGLLVRGDSMVDAGILEGDIVIVRKQPTARSGEIIVALVGDEATVKTLRRKGRKVELHPANEDFAPIVPDPHEFSLLGKVIEVRRYLEGGL